MRGAIREALTFVAIGWYRLRLRWVSRRDLYVGEQWLTERARARQLD